jgi:hypothetical protein
MSQAAFGNIFLHCASRLKNVFSNSVNVTVPFISDFFILICRINKLQNKLSPHFPLIRKALHKSSGIKTVQLPEHV